MAKPAFEVLGDWMKRQQLSQTAAAEWIGISQPALSRIVRGDCMPSHSTAHKIERATGGKVKASRWLDQRSEGAR